ncbi:MAG: copper resistance protein CopC [Chloroflexi bacterium]|nr:copper resistance protein CopC [Chloroflexota bacterium]
MIWLALLAGLVACLAPAGPAFAHAELDRSEPAANSSVAASPNVVRLWFTEDIEPRFSDASILDASGRRVDAGSAPVADDRRQIAIALRGLPQGGYTVAWRTLSSVDGHAARGSFAFGVGVAVSVLPPDPWSVQRPDAAGSAARWLTAAGAAAAAGTFPFLLIVWLPALGRVRPEPQRRALERSAVDRAVLITGGALALVVVGSCGVLGVQAAAVAGDAGLALSPAHVWSLVTGSRTGTVWAARMALAGVLTGILALLVRANRQDRPLRSLMPAGGAVAGALLLTLSMNGHGAAAGANPAVNVAADWAHLAAAAAWVGGVAHLAGQAPLLWALDRRSRAQVLAAAVPRFSTLALTSFAVLAATGLYASVLHVPDLRALTDTAYGSVLGVKLLLLALLAALGLANLLLVRRQIDRAARPNGDRGGADLSVRFWRLAVAETCIGALIMLAVGVLTSTMPARQAVALPGMRPLQLTGAAADLTIGFGVTPYTAGANRFTVQLTGADGTAVPAERVALRFRMNDHDMGEQELPLDPEAAGQFAAQSNSLGMVGSWTVEAHVRRSGKDDVVTAFAVPVADISPGKAAAAAAPDGAALSSGPVVAGQLAALGAVLVLAAWRFGGAANGAGLTGIGLATVLLALAGYVGGSLQLAAPPGAVADTTSVRNPFAGSEASAALGAPLYQQNCQMCHGPRGRGDGPVAASLNPRPADLALHVALHPEGVLYGWITEGVPGTAMPAFRSRLTDDERWHILNYVKSLTAAVDR